MTSPLDTKPEETQQRYDPKLFWQRQELQRQDIKNKETAKDTIVPQAASLNLGQITSRLQPIANIGANAAAGQIVSSQQQKARAEQIAAQKAAAAQAAAQQAALANMSTVGGLGNLNQGSVQGNVTWDRSDSALADLMRKAGFQEKDIGMGLAIAHAESSMNEAARHPNTSGKYAGTVDMGLFQINTMHRGESWFPSNPDDPWQSVLAAKALFDRAGGTWRDWTTYNAGLTARAVPPPRQVTVMAGGNTVTTANGSLRMVAIQKAQAYVNSGVGYVWGGNSLTTGVDCSGLVQQIYKQLGLSLPRTAYQQSMYGQKAPISSLQPGDLVAWYGNNGNGNPVGHIAVYAGNGQILESYTQGKPARRRNLTAKEMSGGGSAFGVKIKFPGE